mgnify:CR=1 FL=1
MQNPRDVPPRPSFCSGGYAPNILWAANRKCGDESVESVSGLSSWRVIAFKVVFWLCRLIKSDMVRSQTKSKSDLEACCEISSGYLPKVSLLLMDRSGGKSLA